MIHGTPMLPFPVVIQPGEAPVKQVVFAATKAILAGVLAKGDPFPSVRELSESLKLHPNTGQKIVAELVRDGFLEVHPGVGTFVTAASRAPDPKRRRLLQESVEQIVVEARRLGLGQEELLETVATTWVAVFGAKRRTGTHAARGALPTRRGKR